MKKLITLFLFLPICTIAQSGWNMNLLGSFDYETNHNTKCNDIWGWEDGNGNEYALVGLENGFSCVDVTNPSSPAEMFFISDINSTWRDIKTWGNYAYITTEANAGLLIVDLTDLTGNTFWHVSQFNNPNTGVTINFTSAHNIYIDENGIAYIFGPRNNGSSVANRGAVFLDVAANAMNPVYIGEWADEYIHDGMARGDTMYAGCIYQGALYVVDVSDKTNPQTIGQHATPNNFTHNAWVSDDGKYVFTTDETSDAYLAAYDISNINNIQEVDRIQSNPGSNSIPHNTHVDGNFLITSYYRDGTTVHDITYPNHMIQVAYYDSYAGSGNGFNGCWGTYPFLSSGNIISSDRDSYNGKGVLNIYGRAFQQACYLMGNVADGINGNNLASVTVTILNTTTTASTNIIGNYQTAIVDSGTYQVVFSTIGYISDTSSILLDNGIMAVLDAQLYPIGSGCTDPLACNYDSLATINDSSCVYPVIWQQTFLICDGDSVVVGSSVYDTTGTYTDTLSSANGCDSIVYTYISITSPIVWQQTFLICDGDSVVVGSSVYNTVGNYTDTLNAANGCDSIVYTNISITPPIVWQQTFLICDGDSVVVGSSVYNTVGNYTDTLNAANGCDSIVYTYISITPPIVWQQAFSICNGDSVVVGSSVYNTAGNYTDTLTTSSGCDSIVYTNISITPPIVWQQTFLICDGDSVVVGSSVYNTAGTYTDTLSSVSGCDSIVYTYIVVDQNTSSYDTLSVNVSMVWNGMTLTVSGDYSIILVNSAGCDSLANLNLTILPSGVQDLSEDNKIILRIINILGEPTKPTSNTPLFYIYDDGTVEKRITVE